MRLFQRRPDPKPFPRPKDIPGIPPAEAARALDALRRMVSIDIARVYHAHLDGLHWQVWLDVTQRRMTLAEWADEWLRKHPSPTVQGYQQEGA